jgi:hypothetical protein
MNMVSVENFEKKQLSRVVVLREHLGQFRLLEHMRQVRSVLQVRLPVLREFCKRDSDQLVPHGLHIHAIPWIVAWDLKVLKTRLLHQVDIVHNPDKLLVDLRTVQAVIQLALCVTEWPARHRFSALLVWRERNEVAGVPRWLRSDDSYLCVAVEVSLDRSNRELKLEAVIRAGYVKPNYLHTPRPFSFFLLVTNCMGFPFNYDALVIPPEKSA